MEKGTRNIMVAAAMSGLVLTGGTSRAADRQGPAIVLRVNNLAGTAREDLGRAQAEAQRIFDDTGVRLVWADVSEGPAATCEGVSLSVSLLSPHLVREAVSQKGSGNFLGSAVQAAGFAVIYSDRVSALAERRFIAEGVLLGRVIAHEVGHLLAGPKHSSTGLMTVAMDTDPTSLRLRFTPQESRAIRTLLESKAGNPGERTGCGN
jgi:hypothetical protein